MSFTLTHPQFWKTQPVPQTLNDNLQRAARGGPPPSSTDQPQEPDGPIDLGTDVGSVRKEPLALPKGYEWCTPDINVDAEVSQRSGGCGRFESGWLIWM